MTRNLFKSHKEDLQDTLGVALATFLPPMLRTYHELRRRVTQGDETVMIAPDDVAASLGYGTDRLQSILQDLKMLAVIDFEPLASSQTEQRITLLIR